MASNSMYGPVGGDTPLVHPECGQRQEKKANPYVYFIDKDHPITPDLKSSQGYLFDIIVVRLDVPNRSIDDTSKFLVDGEFIGTAFEITPSRINVLDFKPLRSIEFFAKPLDLKQQLLKNPLGLKASEKGRTIGYGMLQWPDEFLMEVAESTGEMVHTFETELMKCDGTTNGTMQVLVRLQPKCDEYEEDVSPDGMCRNANKEINPSDILFVVGEEKKICCCSQVGVIPASDSDNDQQPKCLDLSSFRPVNSQNVENTDILASLDPACQKLTTITNHYQTLIDAVKNKTENSHKTKSDQFFTLPNDGFKFPSSSESYSMPVPCRPDRDFAANNFLQVANFENPPELTENKPEPLRHCPVCKENMDYLPKLAACPNCCYKPVPYFKEKSYDDSQDAEQIIKEFHSNAPSEINSLETQKCRCTCKAGINKLCAHCRIRKLCEHIFQPPQSTLKEDDIPETKSSDVNCVSSNDNRPFLTKIFSELKDIYDIEESKPKEIEVDERCERELNKEPFQQKKLPLKKENNAKAQEKVPDVSKEISAPRKIRKLRKRSLKPASEQAVRSRLYDYEFVGQAITSQIGHKTCSNGCGGRRNVPPNMGWLWNIHNPSKWKPGTIRKPIKELMRYFLKDFPADTLLVSKYSYRKRKRDANEPYINIPTQKPTLHVYKKNGEYIITMRLLKHRDVLAEAADPYANMKPMQFRIVKNPRLDAKRNLKKDLKSMGFKKCTCHRPISNCYCRKFIDKKRLEYQCNKECSKRQIEPCCDTLVLSDTSESEAEYDFGVTPPVGLIKPEKLKKINLVNVSTQYDELDWNPVPIFPRPPNKYMQMYQCAVGERKAKQFNAGYGGGGSGAAEDGAKGGGYGGARKGPCPKGVGGVAQFGRDGGFAGPKGGAAGFRSGKDAGFRSGKDAGFRSGKDAGFRSGKDAGFAGARGGGDGFLTGRGGGKSAANDFSGKYGGRGAQNERGENVSQKKVNMLRYVMKMQKKMSRLSPEEAAAKRREKMNLLRGTSPPILCMVDRRGKPIDPRAPCFPCGDYRVC